MIVWIEADPQYPILYMRDKIPDWVFENRSHELVEMDEDTYRRLRKTLDEAEKAYYSVQEELLALLEADDG